MKRQLLDQLAGRHDFPVPESMVEAEFQNILGQLRHEASHEADPQAALAEIEQESADYRKIAERRVRLGLLLSEIGAANGVEISEQEMNRLIAQAASQYQGKERERFLQLVQQEPMFAAQLRAPLYEDKVVDFLFSKAKVTRPRTRPASSSRPTSRARKATFTGRAAATTMQREAQGEEGSGEEGAGRQGLRSGCRGRSGQGEETCGQEGRHRRKEVGSAPSPPSR